MKTKKDILVKKIIKYQKRHVVIFRQYFTIFRKKMAVVYDNQNNLVFYDYYSKNNRYTINKDIFRCICNKFYNAIDEVLSEYEPGLECCTFDILHIYRVEAFFKFAKFLMNVEEYYELYYNSDSIVDVKKLDRRKEFSDVYDIIDNIK